MKLECKKNYLLWIIFAILIFGIMEIFYTSVEPIMVCDPDDWTYISYIRKPWPLWKDWNPAKVFPETFTGMLGYFAAYVISPIIKDYIQSFTWVFATVISFAIMVYILTIAVFLKKVLKMTDKQSVVLAFIAFLMHFLILFSQETDNMFMFTATDLNCFMNYLIPSIFCFILMIKLLMYFLERPENLLWENFVKKNSYNYFKLGCWMVLLYLAVFSNMVCNIVLIAPFIYMFLINISRQILCKGIYSLCSFQIIKKYLLFVYVFGLELWCLIFEYNGGRAASLEFNFDAAVKNIWGDICFVINNLNWLIMSVCLLIIMMAIFLYVYKTKKVPLEKKKRENTFIKIMIPILFSFILCLGYVVLICMRLGLNKLRRCENVFIIYIFFGFAVVIALGYLLINFAQGWIMAPFVLYVMIVVTISGNYKSSIPYYNGDVRLCYAVNQYIIEQYQMVDKKGLSELELLLPDTGLGEFDFSADRISQTLYNHGVVNLKISAQQILMDSNSFYQNIWKISKTN